VIFPASVPPCLHRWFFSDISIWIIGEWAPDEEDFAIGEIIMFNEDGTFSFGDDCTTKGFYKIKGNTVYLMGDVVCYGDVTNYSETITITDNKLKGYRKL
jgi:hypothetical protein